MGNSHIVFLASNGSKLGPRGRALRIPRYGNMDLPCQCPPPSLFVAHCTGLRTGSVFHGAGAGSFRRTVSTISAGTGSASGKDRSDAIIGAKSSKITEETLVMWRGGKTLDYTADMRHAEFRAVADMLGLDSSQIEFYNAIAKSEIDNCEAENAELLTNPTYDDTLWQFIRGISIDEAVQVASRCAIVRRLHEVIAVGLNYSQCARAAAVYPIAMNARTAGLALGETWRLRWKPLHSRKAADKQPSRSGRGRAPLPSSLLRDLAPFTDKLPGEVDLTSPQHVIYILNGKFDLARTSFAQQMNLCQEQTILNQDNDQSSLITLESTVGLDIHRYVLNQRAYLSTSTMHHEVAFIMANMACVHHGSSVCDPFCGSAGILVAAAAVGAGVTVGVDIDPTLDKEGINTNFEQYNLPHLTKLITGDISDRETINGAIIANSGKAFDAIISDPPYGRRERKASFEAFGGQMNKSAMQLAAIDAAILLMQLCATHHGFLRPGGRLVYFLPTRANCTKEQLIPFIPSHPALRLIHVCRQPINQRLIRWLIVLEKLSQEHILEGNSAAAEINDVLVPPGVESVIGYDFEGLGPEERNPSAAFNY